MECSYFALLWILDKYQNQLPSLKGRVVVCHILKVEWTTKVVAIPLRCIEGKCMMVSTSNGIFVCHLANRIERDWLFEDNINCETTVLQCKETLQTNLNEVMSVAKTKQLSFVIKKKKCTMFLSSFSINVPALYH